MQIWKVTRVGNATRPGVVFHVAAPGRARAQQIVMESAYLPENAGFELIAEAVPEGIVGPPQLLPIV